jgi:predicted RNase H-like HicB family nuclease
VIYEVTLVESDEGWAVWCDDLPGCCSQGATKEEALAAIHEAIAEYLEVRSGLRRREDAVYSVTATTIHRIEKNFG